MSAILVYSEDHEGFEYICPGFDSEYEALHYLIENEAGFNIHTEKFSSEDDELVNVIIENDKLLYSVEFLYLDEPAFINPILWT